MEIKGIFQFDPCDKIYVEHFPGNPVVPGSVIVNAFLQAAEEAGLKDDACVIKDFRFKGFVRPGEYAFSIQVHSDQLTCYLFQNDSDVAKTLVTGKIKK